MQGEQSTVDLLDRAGRLRRVAAALAIGAAVALLVGWLFYYFSSPDQRGGIGWDRNVRPWRVIIGMACFAGGLGFWASVATLDWRARRIERANRIPRAQVKS